MKTRVFFAPVLLAYAIACGGQTVPGAAVPMAHAEAAAIPLTEEEAVAAALAENAEIRVAERRLSAAKAKTTTARSLEDPMLMVRDWGYSAEGAVGCEPGAGDGGRAADVSAQGDAGYASAGGGR